MSLLSALLIGAVLSASAPTPPPADRAFFATGDGVRIAYRVDGPANAPPLLLANSIGTTLEMWDAQVAALSRHFRVVRYDMRGHGASGVPAGAYSMDRLGRDALELMDALGIERAHVLGLSLGGYVAQWLGIHAPERVDRLILSNTAAWLGPPERWDAAIADVLAAPDMHDTAAQFLRNWFPARMLDAQDPAVAAFRAMLLATDRRGLAGAWAAVRDADLRRTVSLIQRPTLVVAGEHDTVTRAADGAALAAAIPGARLEVLPTVHLSNVEAPGAYLALVLDFLGADR